MNAVFIVSFLFFLSFEFAATALAPVSQNLDDRASSASLAILQAWLGGHSVPNLRNGDSFKADLTEKQLKTIWPEMPFEIPKEERESFRFVFQSNGIDPEYLGNWIVLVHKNSPSPAGGSPIVSILKPPGLEKHCCIPKFFLDIHLYRKAGFTSPVFLYNLDAGSGELEIDSGQACIPSYAMSRLNSFYLQVPTGIEAKSVSLRMKEYPGLGLGIEASAGSRKWSYFLTPSAADDMEESKEAMETSEEEESPDHADIKRKKTNRKTVRTKKLCSPLSPEEWAFSCFMRSQKHSSGTRITPREYSPESLVDKDGILKWEIQGESFSAEGLRSFSGQRVQFHWEEDEGHFIVKSADSLAPSAVLVPDFLLRNLSPWDQKIRKEVHAYLNNGMWRSANRFFEINKNRLSPKAPTLSFSQPGSESPELSENDSVEFLASLLADLKNVPERGSLLETNNPEWMLKKRLQQNPEKTREDLWKRFNPFQSEADLALCLAVLDFLGTLDQAELEMALGDSGSSHSLRRLGLLFDYEGPESGRVHESVRSLLWKIPDSFVFKSKKLLTAGGEIVLILRYHFGSDKDRQEAKEVLCKANQGLVGIKAKEYLSGKEYSPADWDDLIQYGSIGLFRAIEKFDFRFGFRFSTYADKRILRAIQAAKPQNANRYYTLTMPVENALKTYTRVREVLRTYLDASLPTRKKWNREKQQLESVEPLLIMDQMRDHLKKVLGLNEDQTRAIEALRLQGRGVEIPLPLLADISGLSPAQIEAIQSLPNPNGVPLNETPFKEGGMNRGEMIPDTRFLPPDENVKNEWFQRMVHRIEQTLDDREKEILFDRILKSGEEADDTLKEIGDRFGVSRERVRQLEKRILGKLRKALSAEYGIEYSPKLKRSA